MQDHVRRFNCADRCPRWQSGMLHRVRRRTYQSGSSASSALLIDAFVAASECDHVDMARADPDRLQSISARTSLHARARTQVVCEASARLIAARSSGCNDGLTPSSRTSCGTGKASALASHSRRTPADGSPLAEGGSCHAHTVNSCPTRAAGSSDFCDHAVRLRNRCWCHSSRRYCNR